MICDLGNPFKGNERVSVNKLLILISFVLLIYIFFLTKIQYFHDQISFKIKFETGIGLYTRELEAQLMLSTYVQHSFGLFDVMAFFHSTVVLGSDIIRVVMKGVSSVLVNRLT